MSGASDKARFYLEKAVPQLQEFKEKKIFSEDEIRNMVKKRSDYEHLVLSTGAKAIDFARYAAWEISLEKLRQMRCKRLKIRGSMHTGQPRISQIFDRGTKKRPGDVALWMSYLEYTRKVKATKKFKTILTAAIRLHPTKAELWLYAARWTLEGEADMNGARSYMQRGTRFCIQDRALWIEYAKLEMIYLAKIAMRRKILGLDVVPPPENTEDLEMADAGTGFEESADMIALPKFNDNALQPSMIEKVKVDTEAVKDPMTTPALNGAIPLAIFDAAKKQPFFCPSAASDFFDMFASFTQVRCLPKILQHALDSMMESYVTESCTWDCYVRQPLIGVDVNTAEFPVVLGQSLDRVKEGLEKVKAKDRGELVKKTCAWMERILSVEELDPGIRTVLDFTKRKLN